MTTKKSKNSTSAHSQPVRHSPRTAAKGRWLLRDAKARLSELIKRVHSEGPQRVTVRGTQEVVILTAEEYRRLKGEQTGQALADALAASPLRDVDFEAEPYYPPVRDVEL
jgi:prevent-host-death family protein